MACIAVRRRGWTDLCRQVQPIAPVTLRKFSSSPAHQVQLAVDRHPAPSDSSPSHGPLVILHGLYGSKQNWRSLAKRLAQRIKVDVYALVRSSCRRARILDQRH